MTAVPAIPDAIAARLRDALDGRACCVTGGAGFIGGRLVETLIDLGARVRVIDDLSTATLDGLGPLMDARPERVALVRGSILDDDATAAAVDGAALVFHCAALCSIPRSVQHPERTWAVNTTGTLRVLEAAADAGVRRVVYSASSSAYGNRPGLPKREEDLPAPVSPYGASKLAGEHLCTAFAETYGLSTVSLRYFNVFGPRQRADTPYAGVIPSFASRVLSGEGPRVYGDGSQTRDFTYVDNVVLANLLAAVADRPLTGQVYNIAAGVRVSVNELAERILAGLNAGDLAVEHAGPRAGEVLHSQADISAARADLGYEAYVPFEDGLRRTLAWYRQSGAGASASADAARRDAEPS